MMEMSDEFDFGFTAVAEDDLDAVKTAQNDSGCLEENLEVVQDRLDCLYNAITPLLNNLKANPEKEYILWPNRLGKIEDFEKQLAKIYKG
jgi:hypothetical protein